MYWMLLPLKRYADFSGRSRRKEYWMFNLAIVLTLIVLTVGLMVLFDAGDAYGNREPSGAGLGLALIGGVAYLGIIIPHLAVQVRRFHDQDKSGWMSLLALIPYVGGLVILVFMCIEGTQGENRFGPDPKDPDGVDAAAEIFR